jgi:hypothetical protein
VEAPRGGPGRRAPLPGTLKVIQKEGYGNEHLSIGTPLGNFKVGPFTGDFGRRTRVGSVNGASLPMGVKIGGRAPLIGTLQAT